MQNTTAMLAFYRGLGLDITETPRACSVHIGSQMINFHRPEIWQDPAYTLRAPGTKPPSGDFCVVWEGTEADIRALLERVGARVEEAGPAARRSESRRVEYLHARSGRESAGVHDYGVKPATYRSGRRSGGMLSGGSRGGVGAGRFLPESRSIRRAPRTTSTDDAVRRIG